MAAISDCYASAREVKVGIVLERNGYAVSGCRTEAPVTESGNYLFVDTVPQSLQKLFFNNDALRIDGKLYNHIPL